MSMATHSPGEPNTARPSRRRENTAPPQDDRALRIARDGWRLGRLVLSASRDAAWSAPRGL